MTAALQRPAFEPPHPGAREKFARDIVAGLSQSQKTMPSRYFYDDVGSHLFEAITCLPEYYPTRVETEILSKFAAEITGGLDKDWILIELGSGSSTKTEILLDAAPGLAAYVAVDVSAAALSSAALRLQASYPGLDIRPLEADFIQSIPIPDDIRRHSKLGFFPGSTIGNFESVEALRLLRSLRGHFGPGDRLFVGTDLLKDETTLLRAYDDPVGVTAAFNLNLLARINRTFGDVFDLGMFRHRAVFNRNLSRIEMHLQSKDAQVVRFRGQTFRLREGETIHTENSHKYTPQSFSDLARQGGWRSERVWMDAREQFALHDLMPA